jgi:hypothetical protein
MDRAFDVFVKVTAAVLFVGMFVFAFWRPAIAAGSPREVWQCEKCWTNDCITRTLNSLPSERASEAKLTTWGSGPGAITYVWFRR